MALLAMEVGVRDVRRHPTDDESPSFVGGSPFTSELWVMEDFLPAAN